MYLISFITKHGGNRNSSVAMLAAKRSAGVAPDMNLMILLHVGDKPQARGSTLALKPRIDVTRSPKQGYQWPQEKDSCPPKKFKKYVEVI